jgi:hypothetical protein
MPSKRAATTIDNNENEDRISGITISNAVMEITRAPTVNLPILALNCSPALVSQTTIDENEAIIELELAIANKERRPL